jgi:hypothetical protein
MIFAKFFARFNRTILDGLKCNQHVGLFNFDCCGRPAVHVYILNFPQDNVLTNQYRCKKHTFDENISEMTRMSAQEYEVLKVMSG